MIVLLAPFKLERYFAKYEFNVRYLLCASDCESLTIQELLDLEPGAAERFGRHWLGGDPRRTLAAGGDHLPVHEHCAG
jgi:hypothetical protein